MMEYFDFPLCRDSFCTGQSDARPYEREGVLFRERGRNARRLTVVSWPGEDSRHVAEVVAAERAAGARVGSLDFAWTPRPAEGAVGGPAEWSREEPWSLAGLTKKRRWLVRDARRRYELSTATDRGEAYRVVKRWAEWARGRHFMVSTGHYYRWADLHFSGVYNSTLLVARGSDGRAAGLVGWERHGPYAAITVIKHTPPLPGEYLWAHYLEETEDAERAYCGSMGDVFKRRLGLTRRRSWKFD
jgi:hypothetical protein